LKHCGIIERRVRCQDELRREQKSHHKQCAKVRAIVEMPPSGIAWLRRARGYRTRYRGMRKNASDFGLWAIAYNFWRSLTIKPTVSKLPQTFNAGATGTAHLKGYRFEQVIGYHLG